MGFLINYGSTIAYVLSEKERKIVKDHAKKYVLTWNIKSENTDSGEFLEEYSEPMFGYEAEVHKIFLDDNLKKVQIDLSGELDIEEHEHHISNFTYQLEYGRWMVEGKNNCFYYFSSSK